MSKKERYTHDMKTALFVPKGAVVFSEIVIGLIEHKNGKKSAIIGCDGSYAITTPQRKKFNLVNTAVADALLKVTGKKNSKKHKEYLEETNYDF